jgi:hypothetical protein
VLDALAPEALAPGWSGVVWSPLWIESVSGPVVDSDEAGWAGWAFAGGVDDCAEFCAVATPPTPRAATSAAPAMASPFLWRSIIVTPLVDGGIKHRPSYEWPMSRP